MAILEILKLPDPRLSKPAKKIEVFDEKILSLAEDMLETMENDGGIGLASTQVGIEDSLLVIDLGHKHQNCSHELKDYEIEVEYPLIMANAEIISHSESTNIDTEMCLSLPTIEANIPRYDTVTVRFLNKDNKSQEITTSTFLARVLQHEIDHLNGKTMYNYMSPLKKELALKKLTKLKNASN